MKRYDAAPVLGRAMSRYRKIILIARSVSIAATLLCMFGGALFPPLHMLGGIPVLMTLATLAPWDRMYRRWELRRRRRRRATAGST